MLSCLIMKFVSKCDLHLSSTFCGNWITLWNDNVQTGRDKLVDARSIKEAIEHTKRERQAFLEANRTAGTQETGTAVTLPDEDEEMEVEMSSENTQVSFKLIYRR